jgi:hypothetical protein
MEQILTRAITQWNSTGAATQIRPVWSVATDGNATRCTAGHRLFIKSLLSESSELYGTLINMLGLNLLQEHPLLAWPLFIFLLALAFYLYLEDYARIHMQYLFWLTVLSPFLYWLYFL